MTQELINALLSGIISVSIAFVILVITRFIVHKMFKTEYVSVNEIEKNGNIAVAIKNGSIYIGVAAAMVGVIASPLVQFIDGITAMLFVIIASVVSDKIVFSSVDNTKEIGKGNISLALAEAGLFIGTGIIAMASFTGEGPYISSIVFFALGQIILILSILAAEMAYKGLYLRR